MYLFDLYVVLVCHQYDVCKNYVGSVLCPCIFCVALLIYLFLLFVACLSVIVNCLVKQFAM